MNYEYSGGKCYVSKLRKKCSKFINRSSERYSDTKNMKMDSTSILNERERHPLKVLNYRANRISVRDQTNDGHFKVYRNIVYLVGRRTFTTDLLLVFQNFLCEDICLCSIRHY